MRLGNVFVLRTLSDPSELFFYHIITIRFDNWKQQETIPNMVSRGHLLPNILWSFYFFSKMKNMQTHLSQTNLKLPRSILKKLMSCFRNNFTNSGQSSAGSC